MEVKLVKVKGIDIGSSCNAGGNLDNFDPTVEFKHYDRYELYQDDGQYEYDTNNENIEKYMISDWRNGELKERVKYVLISKIWRPTDDEIKLYEKHCQCIVCTAWILNPMRYLTCRCCVGCMRARDFNDDLEVRARTCAYLHDKKLL